MKLYIYAVYVSIGLIFINVVDIIYRLNISRLGHTKKQHVSSNRLTNAELQVTVG